MDKVRFGKALGKGTRAAAGSLWEAAQAAASADPHARPAGARSAAAQTQTAPPQRPAAHFSAPPPSSTAARQAAGAFGQARRVSGAARQARGSVLAPVRKFSSVLWLEVTGTFFTLVAIFLGQGVWKMRAAALASPSSPQAQRFYIYLAIFLLFAYFAVSSFMRARRRARQQ